MFITLGDLVVHAEVSGPAGAPPLLMLHSIGTDLSVWQPQAAALAARFRVIRPDLRGHGLSGAPATPASMAQLAADAAALLHALGVKAAHVAGLSIGGRIALEFAARYPEQVLSLVLCDTALEFPPPDTWQARIDAVATKGMSAIADAVMERWVCDASLASSHGLRRMLLTTDPAGYAACAAALRDARAEDVAGKVKAPTTVVVGERDPATPPATAEAIRDSIPGAVLVTIPEASHIPTFEQDEAVSRAFEGHFTRLAELGSGREAGLTVRRAVLGETHVARAQAGITPLDAPFQEWITANVWGGIWTRPGLDRRTRSMLTLAMMAALARHEEFVLHVKATRNTGVTPDEIGEILLQVGAYAGVPVANHALKLAKETLKAMEEGA